MAKKKPPSEPDPIKRNAFAAWDARKRRGLVLARFLADEADKNWWRGDDQDRAYAILQRWADLERDGVLARKETSLGAEFLHEVFGQALGYRSATESPQEYELEREFTIPQGGTADAALGNFTPGNVSPLVVVELKAADVNLDRDRSAGRTPVQQCWDYLNALPDCPWGIVSNFVSTRLYHRDKTPHAFEEFRLADLRDLRRFRQFYCLFERGGVVRAQPGFELRVPALIAKTENRQREVGDELYETYRHNRYRLIEHLRHKLGRGLDEAIHIAQKVLDRIVFIAFCEDRGLLPEKCIDLAYRTLPPFTKVTNPRWRNFLDLFHAVDAGHAALLNITRGYNGGLFRHDPLVDDLQLDDDWTNFFRSIGGYDFRDEVNVDVLGHLFEKSVAEIEKIRVGGLFASPPPGAGDALDKWSVSKPAAAEPTMPKSAERKRLGIYYTPPEFTRFIVDQTLGELVREGLEAVRAAHGIPPERIAADRLADEQPSEELAAFWRECLAVLRGFKVCDPACGSGAFLIQAFDLLERHYTTITEQIFRHERHEGPELLEQVPDFILADNLFGVDLSPQAVEITQLALWIRSAQRNRTLADLSSNVICGNSLVSDANEDPRAVDWQAAFPQVFTRPDRAGFDCAIGNPPWERLKLQEREFFAFSAPDIAGAVSAAQRRQRIVELETANADLFDRYTRAKQAAERTLAHVRTAGKFPLTGKGDLNTYSLFAEMARRLVAPTGRVGLLVPSGIATDDTTKGFFAELMESKALVSLHDFENKAAFFKDVHRAFKFCTLIFGGAAVKQPVADFAFFLRRMEDLEDKKRHIALSSKDLALLNPNTRTCPVFRSRRDAALTKSIYGRVPILLDRNRREGGNPWGVKFVRMFDQTNDAELFHNHEQLTALGFKHQGNRWTKGKRTFLPLYEAKMVQAYDHRAASVVVAAGNWVRQGQTEATTLVGHQNPEFVVQPRWWVDEADVARVLKQPRERGFIGFKDITSPTNQRTMIASAIPWCGLTNHFPVILTTSSPRLELCLLANLNSYILDYVARQKIGGVTLNFFIVNQLPIFPPDRYAEKCPWNKRQTLERWISDRVLKLTCTSDDVRPLAAAADFDPPIHKWHPAERARIVAELDAAYFLLYGVDRDDAQYMLGTFAGGGSGDEDEAAGPSPADASVLEAYDRLCGG